MGEKLGAPILSQPPTAISRKTSADSTHSDSKVSEPGIS